MSGGRARAVRGRVPGVAAAARVGCAAQPPVLECAAPASSGRRSRVSAAEAWGPRARCGWRRRRPGPQGESQRPEHSAAPLGLRGPRRAQRPTFPPSPSPPPKLLQQRKVVREGAATRAVAPPRPERPVSAARSETWLGGGGGPAGRPWLREGEGAEGRGARRCPGLICRYCGSGGGGGGRPGGIGLHRRRRGAGPGASVRGGAAPGPPPQSRPGRRVRAGAGAGMSCLEARSGAAWGPSPETNFLSCSFCSESRRSPSPAGGPRVFLPPRPLPFAGRRR